jgi:hypothetical protein
MIYHHLPANFPMDEKKEENRETDLKKQEAHPRAEVRMQCRLDREDGRCPLT